jgi:hypothetical protein
MTSERALPPGRAGEGHLPGSPGPRRLEPADGSRPPDPRRLEPADGSHPPDPRRLEPADGSRSPGSRRPQSGGPGPPGARSPGAADNAGGRQGRASGGAALSTPAPASRGPRRLAPPRAIRVRADAAGRPEAVGDRAVEAVRESWLVEDRWWTDAPLRRRYWEVVTADGRDLVVFRDLRGGRWYAQR